MLHVIVAKKSLPMHESRTNIDLEREPFRYCKGDREVTFDEQVNVLERYCNGDVSYTFTKPYR